MLVEITDDFDLFKISDSGQCFRVKRFGNNIFRFITRGYVLYISKESDHIYSVSCSEDEWQKVWFPYFDLPRHYCECAERISPSDTFLKRAYNESRGIRILVQDPWETLISFIISQRKSIPAIKKSIELIASCYGGEITTPYETIHLFPTPEEMIKGNITREKLQLCKVGYRADYILDALFRVTEGRISLDEMSFLNDEDLFSRLLEIRGVGKKVANCVCLFSYNRTSLVPIDTWIQKVFDTQYGGSNPLGSYGDYAGIMQQYIFYYAQMHKDEFR